MPLLHMEITVAIDVPDDMARSITTTEAVLFTARGLINGASQIDPSRVEKFNEEDPDGCTFIQITLEDDNKEFPGIHGKTQVEEFLAN